MGPRVFLAHLPIGLEQQTELRLWLLPLLKAHIRNTELGFFTAYFLPLARVLKDRAAACTNAGKHVEARHSQAETDRRSITSKIARIQFR